MIVLVASIAFAILIGLALIFEFRLRGIEAHLRKATDLSSVNLRLEQALSQLQAVPRIEQRIDRIDLTLRGLPGALEAVGRKIDRMFQEFEEKTLPEDAKQIGAQALSRIAQARAEMERQEQDSLKRFNEAVEKGDRARMTPIVARGGL